MRNSFGCIMFDKEKMFTALFNSIEEPVLICELVWRDNELPLEVIIHDVNPAYEKLSELKMDKAMGRSVKEVLVEDEIWRDKSAEAVRKQKPLHFQRYYENMNRWYNVQVNPLGGDCFVTVFVDITEFKLIEEKEEIFKTLMDNNPSLVFIKDEEGKYEYLNKSYEKQFIHNEDWYGKTDYDFWPKKSADLFRINDVEVLENNRVHQFMEDSTDKNGNRYCWLNYKFPMIDSHGNKFLGGMGIDATDYVKAEEELQKTRDNYKHLIQYAPTGIYEIDFKGPRFKKVNDVMCQILGYSKEELIEMNPMELMSDESQKLFQDRIHRASKGEKITDSVDFKLITKDGREIWTELNSKFSYKDGKLEGAFVVAHDITKRKKAEEELKNSEERFRAFVEASSDVVYRMNPDWSEMQQLHGVKFIKDTNSPTDTWMEKYIYTDDQSHVQEAINSSIDNKSIFDYEHRVLQVDGTLGWTHSRAVPILDKNGEILEWFGTAKNITLRKVMEEKLLQNQAEIQTLFENIPAGMVLFDAQPPYTVLVHNKYYQELFAEPYRSQGMEGLNIYEYAPQVDAEGVVEVFNEVIQTKKAVEYHDFPYKSNYPHQSWFDWYMLPVMVGGNVISLVSMSVDVTARHNMEEALQESYERFDLAQKVSNVGTFEWNIQTGINTWTPELEAMYGLQEGAFPKTQEAWEELLYLEDKQEALDAVDVALDTGKPIETEFRVIWPDKSMHWLLGRWQAIKDKNGNLLKLVGVNVDITERKKAEENLQKLLNNEKDLTQKLYTTNVELEKVNVELINQQNVQRNLINRLEISNRELEQFAYVASHDLQEPLRMVISFTQLLEKKYKDMLDEDADDYIGFIVEGSHRMKDLIDDLLAFSRFNTEKVDFKLTDLNQVLDDVLFGLKSTIKEEDVHIVRDSLPMVYCDSSQIGQVFQNLLSNSIKFHQTAPRIHISAEENDMEWMLGVSDEGIGIHPDHHKQIFDVFKRLHTRQEYAGTGIGLSICKRIVERHNGRIWIESKLGKGASFYFTIPKTKLLTDF